jgi:hypothetical protein
MQSAVVEPVIPGPLQEYVTPGSADEQMEAEVTVQVRLAPEPQVKFGREISCVTTMSQVCVQPLEVLVAITV